MLHDAPHSLTRPS